MHPGKRPNRAIFSAQSVEKDSIGNENGALSEIGRAWVSLEAVSGREFLGAGGDRADVTHKLRMARPRFAIPSSAVVTVAGRTLTVQAVLDTPGESEILLMCAEKRA